MDLLQALLAAGEALLIGFLIGAQREASREETEQQPGVRDFTLIALVGAFCGFIDSDWIIAATLIAISGLLAVYHQSTAGRSGITTEIAAVATFFLGYLTATHRVPQGTLLAVAVTVLILFILRAKTELHAFVRKTITETEFRDTIRFLALVFVIYPVLPEQPVGPYDFFDARKVWLFVILVCSISYFGYFLRKFAGEKAGTRLGGVLGGIASSTAATAAFARLSKSSTAEEAHGAAGAAAIANAMQFPRILLLLYFFDASLAQASQWILLAMAAIGAIVAFLYWRGASPSISSTTQIRNPLSLSPALKLGALLTAVLFVSKASLAAFGRDSVQWLGAITGLADVDAILLPVTELHQQGMIATSVASSSVLLALVSNALTKTVIAMVGGTRQFAVRVIIAFLCMFGTGGAIWLVQSTGVL
jgi:uncharacterized membrane protein (DUF4010 family)